MKPLIILLVGLLALNGCTSQVDKPFESQKYQIMQSILEDTKERMDCLEPSMAELLDETIEIRLLMDEYSLGIKEAVVLRRTSLKYEVSIEYLRMARQNIEDIAGRW